MNDTYLTDLGADPLIKALQETADIFGHHYARATSAELAKALRQSRQSLLEEAVMNVLSSGQGKGDSAEQGAPGFLDGLVSRMVGAAMSRRKSNSVSYETSRSHDAQTAWNLSRGQQAALLAQMIQRGTRNL